MMATVIEQTSPSSSGNMHDEATQPDASTSTSSSSDSVCANANAMTCDSRQTTAGRASTVVEAIALQPELENTLKLRNAFRDADKFYRLVRKPNGRSVLPTDFTDVLDFRCPEANTPANRERLFKVATVRCATHNCDANPISESDVVNCFAETASGSKPSQPCQLEWNFLVDSNFAREWQAKPEPGPPLVQRPKSAYTRYPGSFCLDARTTQDDLGRASSVDHQPFKGPSRGATMWACRGLPGLYVITHALSEYDQLEWSLRAFIQHAESEHNNITNLANLRGLKSSCSRSNPNASAGGPCGGGQMSCEEKENASTMCQESTNAACSEEQSQSNSSGGNSTITVTQEEKEAKEDQEAEKSSHADLFVNACAAFLNLREHERKWAESIAAKEDVHITDIVALLGIESLMKTESTLQDEADESEATNEGETTTSSEPQSSHVTNAIKLQRKARHLRTLYLTAPELVEARARFSTASIAMKDLRWSSLGFHYDWTMRSYHEASKSLFPASFRAAAVSLVSPLVQNGLVKPVQPEAGIVNYYPLGTQMGAHIDDAEPAIEQPIVSVSLGAAAVFLIGTHKRTEIPTAMYLRSGDAIIMDGPSRLCFHAVPRIIEKSLNESGLRAASNALLESYRRDLATPAEEVKVVTPDVDAIETERPELADCFKGVDVSLLVGSVEDTLLPHAIGPALERAGITIEDAVEFLIITLRETRINMNIRQVNDSKFGPPSTKRLRIPAEAANCGAYAASDDVTFHKLCEAAVTVSTCAQRKAAQIPVTDVSSQK